MLVSTSDTEGGPVPILESLSCGTPVVCTDTGMPLDIDLHNRAGLVVNKNEEAIAAAIRLMIKDREQYLHFSSNARKVVCPRLDSPSWSSQYMKLIEKTAECLEQ